MQCRKPFHFGRVCRITEVYQTCSAPFNSSNINCSAPLLQEILHYALLSGKSIVKLQAEVGKQTFSNCKSAGFCYDEVGYAYNPSTLIPAKYKFCAIQAWFHYFYQIMCIKVLISSPVIAIKLNLLFCKNKGFINLIRL